MSHRARQSRSTSKGRKRARLVDSAAGGRRNQSAQPARPQTYNERQLDSIIFAENGHSRVQTKIITIFNLNPNYANTKFHTLQT